MTDQEKAERTSWLKKSVALNVGESGRDAGRVMVPFVAHHLKLCDAPTISSLARAIDVNRSALSLCLAIYKGQARDKLRRKLEAHLGLTAGGMTDVLSVLEALK